MFSHRTHGTHRTFWQRRASHRCSQIRRVWHPCHTHAAKFCEFCAIRGRTAHPNHLCSSVPSVGEKIFPQNAHTEPSGREESPTDEHGCSQIRRVWHPCHTHAAKFCEFRAFRVRTAHSKHLCKSVKSVGEKIFPQNARNAQNLLAEKSLPRMNTDVHRLGGYGIPAIPTLPNSVNSVNSVGEQRPPTICVHPCHLWEKRYSRRTHGTFWQRRSSHRLAQMLTDVGGYGIPAIPTLPNSVYSVYSVGEQRTLTICVHPCHPWEKRYSRRTHTRNLLAEKSLPQMSTDVHRLGGYGIPAIPTLPNSVYSVNSVGELRTITICVHPYHPWESFLCKKVLCVPCHPWEE